MPTGATECGRCGGPLATVTLKETINLERLVVLAALAVIAGSCLPAVPTGGEYVTGLRGVAFAALLLSGLMLCSFLLLAVVRLFAGVAPFIAPLTVRVPDMYPEGTRRRFSVGRVCGEAFTLTIVTLVVCAAVALVPAIRWFVHWLYGI